HFKAIRYKLYETQLQEPAALGHLNGKAFSKVLKYGIENNGLAEITQELKTRLASRSLLPQDLYLLLFQSDNEDLKEQAYQHLKANVQDAASIISIARVQESDWQGIEYIEEQHDQTCPFHIWLVVNNQGERQTTEHPGEHTQKQPAKHRACLKWIESYLRETLVPPEQRVQPAPPEPAQAKDTPPAPVPTIDKRSHPILGKQLKDGQMFVSLLLELCQGLQWPSPSFEIRASGEAGFTCECRLEAMSEKFVGEATATKKQRAKHLSARAVLEQLQERAGEVGE
ncbi:MAG: putative dsRNA-binding protein, partial [Thermosynechococcaceae cyanobacterium MS004]|nr:putative dsRNA-binding protein [Thermosynechococcaceae cyanobacterium MS004]